MAGLEWRRVSRFAGTTPEFHQRSTRPYCRGPHGHFHDTDNCATPSTPAISKKITPGGMNTQDLSWEIRLKALIETPGATKLMLAFRSKSHPKIVSTTAGPDQTL